MDFKEADMFLPLKAFFEEQGFVVKGEVKGFDVVLERDGEFFGIEMKKAFNMTLLHQALRRQGSVSAVFVALPRAVFEKKRGNILHILERLDLGLMTVAMDSPSFLVECHILPNMPKSRNTKATRALIAEFNGRNFDENIGGGNKTKLMTAYRERALQIAVALDICGQASAPQLVRDFACPEKTYSILQMNTYGWFEKVAKGVFALSEEGKVALKDPAYTKVVEFYKGRLKK